MTPDQLRQLAEMTPAEAERLANETFGLIERSNPEPAPLMNTFEATDFRAAWNLDVKSLSRKTMPTLRDLERAEMAKIGRTRLVGQLAKDELIGSILELRGYTTARLNESIHVLYHRDGATNSACEHCQAIERSEASGNSYEANLPIGTDSDTINAQAPGLRAARATCNHPVDDDGECGRSECEPDYPVEYVMAPDIADIRMRDVSMALAEHAASAIGKILGS